VDMEQQCVEHFDSIEVCLNSMTNTLDDLVAWLDLSFPSPSFQTFERARERSHCRNQCSQESLGSWLLSLLMCPVMMLTWDQWVDVDKQVCDMNRAIEVGMIDAYML
jgi:hypothetical protein